MRTNKVKLDPSQRTATPMLALDEVVLPLMKQIHHLSVLHTSLLCIKSSTLA